MTWIEVKNPDIAVLTETNLKSSEDWNWSNFELLNCGEGKGTGVSLVLNKKSVSLQNITKSDDGRLLIAELESKGEFYKVAGIYAPAKSTERRKWLKTHLLNLTDIDIALGDFNVNLNKPEDSPNNIAVLEEFKRSLDLKEIPPQNTSNTFYHCNKSHKGRLDHLYIAKELANGITQCQAFPTTFSDHFYIEAILLRSKGSGTVKSIWRMNNFTLKDEETIEKISHLIKEHTSKWITRNPIKSWNILKSDLRSLLKSREKELKLKHPHKMIADALIEYETSVLTEDIENQKIQEERINQLIETTATENRANRMATWDILSELPSPLATRIIKGNQQRCTFDYIREPSTGAILTLYDDMQRAATMFYKELYSHEPYDETGHKRFLSDWNKSFTQKDIDLLEEEISIEEIKEAIRATNGNKAPGKDGLTGLFYKSFSEELAPLLYSMYANFRENRLIPRSFKEGVTTLLQKKGGLKGDLGALRPISLLNADYKILTWTLNSRLQRSLPYIIGPQQTGFQKGRFLLDNIIAMSMAFEKVSRNELAHRFSTITLYDFQKAFDLVSHEAILNTLRCLGTGPNFLSLIEQLLGDSTSSIRLNGGLGDPFQLQRGTRQGDPLSPTLFALVAEPMAQKIIKENGIKGINIGPDNSPTEVKILQYADDVALISRTMGDHSRADEIIEAFCRCTTQRINKDKTKIIFLGAEFDTRYRQDEGNTTYLGHPISRKGFIPQTPQKVERLKLELTRWGRMNVSLKARAKIFNGYAASKLLLPGYSEPTPNGETLKKLDDLIARYIWDVQHNGPFRNKMAMARVKNHPSTGGLGIRYLEDQYKAQKAWVHARALCSDTIYSQAWKKNLEIRANSFNTAPYLTPLIKEGHEAWMELFGSSPSYIPPLKEIYKVRRPTETILTPGQEKWIKDLELDWETCWKKAKEIPNPRHANLLWRILNRILPVAHDSVCQACGRRESIKHIFITCPRSKKLIKWLMPMTQFRDWDIKTILCPPDPKGVFGPLLWTLWETRNKELHEGLVCSPEQARSTLERESARSERMLSSRFTPLRLKNVS